MHSRTVHSSLDLNCFNENLIGIFLILSNLVNVSVIGFLKSVGQMFNLSNEMIEFLIGPLDFFSKYEKIVINIGLQMV